MNFSRGFMSIRFQNLQMDYLKTKKHPTPGDNADRWGKEVMQLVLTFYRTMWRHRCEVVKIERNATMEKRKREEALDKCSELRNKWWQLLPSDQYLLDKRDDFFRNAKFVNVYIWREKLKAALIRGAHLTETRGSVIRNYMVSMIPEDRISLNIQPTQMMHRKVMRRRVPSSVRKGTVNVREGTKVRQSTLVFDSRTMTTSVLTVNKQIK